MSRGPGRIMQAALAELGERGTTGPFSVARRARHDSECGCTSRHWEEDPRRPSRSELVAARRALATLEERGECSLTYRTFPGHDGVSGRWLEATAAAHGTAHGEATDKWQG